MPENILTLNQQPKVGVYGATVTTINGTDTISGSRTTINTNFSNLNTAKEEISDLVASSSETLGTITSGIWNATTLAVGYGGTNETSFANSTNALYYNGTGIVSAPWISAIDLPFASSTSITATSSAYFATLAGNVGIATTTPLQKLEVYSTASTSITVDTNSATQGGCILLKNTKGVAGYTELYGNGSGSLLTKNVSSDACQ